MLQNKLEILISVQSIAATNPKFLKFRIRSTDCKLIFQFAKDYSQKSHLSDLKQFYWYICFQSTQTFIVKLGKNLRRVLQFEL